MSSLAVLLAANTFGWTSQLPGVAGGVLQALLIATVLIGLSDRVLNIPDQVHKFYRDREAEFDATVRPRLSVRLSWHG